MKPFLTLDMYEKVLLAFSNCFVCWAQILKWEHNEELTKPNNETFCGGRAVFTVTWQTDYSYLLCKLPHNLDPPEMIPSEGEEETENN